MNYLKALLLFIATLFLTWESSYGQSPESPTIVLVHGAWGGGWAFKEVDSILTSQNAIVYRPTLTGQGEKVHLATKDVGLETHITDIVNTILFEELNNIILVGHSYGGMVITGVTDRIPDRIKQLIYVDAFVPEDGESLFTIGRRLGVSEDGFIDASWVPKNAPYPKDVPHPYKTITDKIILKNKQREKISSTYILTVQKGTKPKDDGFYDQMNRAKMKGWPILELEADHNMQWSAPVEFSNMILEIAKD